MIALRRPADPVERQLRDIARQGSGMAAVAHVCAAALLILFSAASFVALGGDAFAAILRQWQATRTLDIPSAISLAVITLMVLAFDVGMLYAASMLRLLASRRASVREQWVHVAVMVGVALIEAATYIYMAYRYEHPATWLAWGLIIVRALAAPLLAVYLSMARSLPVTARDILAQVELASGAGLIRDTVRIANDPAAPLERKAEMYSASAVMLPAERTRLDDLLVVLGRTDSATSAWEPPTDGGTPIATPAAEHPPLPAPELPDDHSAIAEPDEESGSPPRRTGTRLVALPRNRIGNRAGNRAPRRTQAQLRAMAFGLLDSGEVTTRAELWEQLRPIRQETSNRLFHAWEIARGRQGQPRQVRAARAR